MTSLVFELFKFLDMISVEFKLYSLYSKLINGNISVERYISMSSSSQKIIEYYSYIPFKSFLYIRI